MRPQRAHRLFVVGCPRSGTTLLQSLLAAHPQVVSLPESDFFHHLLPKQRWARQLGLASPKSRRNHLAFLARVAPDAPARASHFRRRLARCFCAELDRLSIRRGCGAWVEKTPHHLHRLDLIEALVPEARFIHVLRNGADVIASLYEVSRAHPETWGRLRHLRDCIDRWLRDVEISRAAGGRAGHVLVRYEGLVKDPRETLEALCAFAGLSFEAAMLEEYAAASRGLILDHEQWKDGAERPIGAVAARKFEAILDADQQREVLETVSSVDLDSWCP